MVSVSPGRLKGRPLVLTAVLAVAGASAAPRVSPEVPVDPTPGLEPLTAFT